MRFSSLNLKILTTQVLFLSQNRSTLWTQKVKGQLSKDIVVRKKKISSNTAAEDKRIECSRMMRKSMSFSSNATDAKVKPLASNFSLVEDLKK